MYYYFVLYDIGEGVNWVLVVEVELEGINWFFFEIWFMRVEFEVYGFMGYCVFFLLYGESF